MDEKLKALLKEIKVLCIDYWEQDYYIASLDDFKNGTEHLRDDIEDVPFSIYTNVQECLDKVCNKTGNWKIYKVQPLETLSHKVNSEWLTTHFTVLKCVRAVSVVY